MEQLPALATAPNTWGGGCSGTSISHSGSSIVHRVTGREELDWTSPDWNKPLLPLLLFTTPYCPLPPPSTAVSHIYQGKNGSKCQGFRAKNPTAGVGVEAEQHPPTHHHAAQRASRTAAWERRQTQLTYSVRCCVLVQGGYFQLGIHNQSLETAAEL